MTNKILEFAPATKATDHASTSSFNNNKNSTEKQKTANSIQFDENTHIPLDCSFSLLHLSREEAKLRLKALFNTEQ